MDIKMDPRYLVVEGCKIVFLNFAGRPTQYNTRGDKNFVLVLTPDVADVLRANGWNIGALRPRDPADPPIPKLNVKVNMQSAWPPAITILPSDMSNRVPYDSTMVSELDRMRFAPWPETKFTYMGQTYGNHVENSMQMPYLRVDLILHLANTGGAYLTSFAGIIQEDPLEAKYSNIPIAGVV